MPVESLVQSVLVLVDSRVAAQTTLMAGLPIGSRTLTIDPAQNPLTTISTALAAGPPVDRLVLIAHGEPGSVALGSGFDMATLLDHSHAVAGWRSHLMPSATIQLLACAAGAGAAVGRDTGRTERHQRRGGGSSTRPQHAGRRLAAFHRNGGS